MSNNQRIEPIAARGKRTIGSSGRMAILIQLEADEIEDFDTLQAMLGIRSNALAAKAAILFVARGIGLLVTPAITRSTKVAAAAAHNVVRQHSQATTPDPEKSDSASSTAVGRIGAKRGRRRAAVVEAGKEWLSTKRPRGRPRKNPVANPVPEEEQAAPRKKMGRPKKVESAANKVVKPRKNDKPKNAGTPPISHRGRPRKDATKGGEKRRMTSQLGIWIQVRRKNSSEAEALYPSSSPQS